MCSHKLNVIELKNDFRYPFVTNGINGKGKVWDTASKSVILLYSHTQNDKIKAEIW